MGQISIWYLMVLCHERNIWQILLLNYCKLLGNINQTRTQDNLQSNWPVFFKNVSHEK